MLTSLYCSNDGTIEIVSTVLFSQTVHLIDNDMDRGFADAKFGSGGADRGPVLYDVKSKALRPLLHISLQSTTLPAFCCFILCGPKQAYARGNMAAPHEKILENQKNRDRITITILLQKECWP